MSAGYLDLHAPKYVEAYAIKAEELFCVQEGFPRITSVPEGVGNLRYSIIVGCCTSYRVDVDEYISRIAGGPDA